MLQRIHQALRAALRAFRTEWLTPSLYHPRPVWDDGTDYDVPTFLRRGAPLPF